MVLKPGTAAAASADARGIACMADETHDTAGMAAATQAQQAPTQTEAAAPSSHKQPSSVAELVDAGRAAAAVRDANTRAQSQQQRLSDLVAAEHPITDERLYSHKPHGDRWWQPAAAALPYWWNYDGYRLQMVVVTWCMVVVTCDLARMLL